MKKDTHKSLESNASQPQRALTFIKQHHPQPTFHKAFLALFRAMWTTSTHHDISKPELLHAVLSDSHLFSPSEVDAILAGADDKKYKDMLLTETEKVLGLGAFGSPWFWVRNAEGKEEPFFGSDRLVLLIFTSHVISVFFDFCVCCDLRYLRPYHLTNLRHYP